MKINFPDRLEIFLALALNRRARENSINEDAPTLSEQMPALFEYLSAAETEKLERIWRDYQNKTAPEKSVWRGRVIALIGADEFFIDEQVHQSHISEALKKEIPSVRRIVRRLLPPDFPFDPNSAHDDSQTFDAPFEKSRLPLEKTVRRAFAKHFVALRDLKKITAFDRLSGAQTARLIRLNGIREVATACVRIEAVEAVAAFLRIFSAEDAQAIAAQLNALPNLPEERLMFAEQIVQATLESEPQPSAMLDLLGIQLLGVVLYGADDWQIRYAKQKLPLEIAPKLAEIIDERRIETNANLREQISTEIERLAQTLLRAKSRK